MTDGAEIDNGDISIDNELVWYVHVSWHEGCWPGLYLSGSREDSSLAPWSEYDFGRDPLFWFTVTKKQARWIAYFLWDRRFTH